MPARYRSKPRLEPYFGFKLLVHLRSPFSRKAENIVSNCTEDLEIRDVIFLFSYVFTNVVVSISHKEGLHFLKDFL